MRLNEKNDRVIAGSYAIKSRFVREDSIGYVLPMGELIVRGMKRGIHCKPP